VKLNNYSRTQEKLFKIFGTHINFSRIKISIISKKESEG
jgi:hypothetical protein